MPDMSKPLAHIESLLETVRYKIIERKENKMRLEAAIAALEEVERELRLCLRDEKAKLASPSDIHSLGNETP